MQLLVHDDNEDVDDDNDDDGKEEDEDGNHSGTDNQVMYKCSFDV